MTKLPLLFAFFTLFICLSCYKENRIKPVYQEEEQRFGYPILNSVTTRVTNKIDSNLNGNSSAFNIDLQMNFRNRGLFSYEISYTLQYSQDFKTNWILKKNIMIDQSLKYYENVFINVDSILRSVNKKSSRLVLNIKFKNENGGIIEIPASISGTPSMSDLDFSYEFVETKEIDRTYYVRNFNYNLINLSSDKNLNNFKKLPSKLNFTISPLPKTAISCYVLMSYKMWNQYNEDYIPFAEIKQFVVNPGDDFIDIALPVHYSIDTTSFLKGNYNIKAELYDFKSKEILDTYSTSESFEKYSDDIRIFDLSKFELKDLIDNDKDSFASSYNSVINISSSDRTSKKYIAKILYSNYGQDNYDQLVQLTLNCDSDNEVIITGGSLLAKGYYDLKIELYDYNAVFNTSEGQVIRTWQILENKNLQAIPLERISEDIP